MTAASLAGKYSTGPHVGAERPSRIGCGALFLTDEPEGGESMPDSCKSVLVIDDSAEVLSALTRLLHTAGYTVSIARNGQEALDRLSIGKLPDVIVLDLAMPVMHGWQFR